MMGEEWVGDPAKYAELAKPFANADEARKALAEFFAAVRKLREQYRIPELIFQCMVYATEGDMVAAITGGAGFGDQAMQAKLAKRSFDTELDAFFTLHDKLMAKRPRLGKYFVTDPK